MQEINEISIHAPARGATVESTYQLITQYISIHAPARGATTPRHPPSQDHGISIHAPARGATENIKIVMIYLSEFQSTLPRGERRHRKYLLNSPQKFQSTLPRGERQKITNGYGAGFCISIHAPARGATGDAQNFAHPFFISIHAPARGATSADISGLSTTSFYFNPRSREGSDMVVKRCH